MNKKTTAAIVATGNEVVFGQIVNTNTSMLADLLTSDGLSVEFHFSVLDRIEDLKETLTYIKSKKIDHVFLIGGLGPTQDDLTRGVVSEFTEKKLGFNEEAWKLVENLLKNRSIVIREGHKKQCYFPDSAEILRNDVGTAQGFKVEKDKFSIWCIPGPPSECRSVYQNGIAPWIKNNIMAQIELKNWQCINVPESEVAHAVEEALKDCDYDLGFRASPPIVEVKLWVPVEDIENKDADKWIRTVEKIVEPYLYSRQGKDYLKDILDFLRSKGSFDLIDSYSKGYLFQEVLKINENKLPDQMHFSTKSVDFESERQLSLVEEEKTLSLELKSIDLNLNVTIDVDSLKSSKNKRYRMTACARLIKALHTEIFR